MKRSAIKAMFAKKSKPYTVVTDVNGKIVKHMMFAKSRGDAVEKLFKADDNISNDNIVDSFKGGWKRSSC